MTCSISARRSGVERHLGRHDIGDARDARLGDEDGQGLVIARKKPSHDIFPFGDEELPLAVENLVLELPIMPDARIVERIDVNGR